MSQRVLIRRTRKPDSPPNGLSPGELFVEMNDPVRLWTGVPPEIDPTQRKLLVDLSAVIPPPDGGGGAQVYIDEVPPAAAEHGDLWWESDSGQLFIYYADADSAQWVAASLQGSVGPQGLKGDVGATGAKGDKGDKGDTGTAGAPGAAGATGPTGPAGPKGDTGAAGPTGATGPAGTSSLAHGMCRLTYVSTTEIRLLPRNGDRLICNGKVCSIPLAGVPLSNAGLPASLATTNRQLTTNVETLTFASVPAAWAGAVAAGGKIGVIGVGGASIKDGTRVLSAQTATTLSFPLTAANETLAADTGGRVYPILYVYAADVNDDQIVDALEWSWAGYTLSAGGILTKIGDATRTLVGMFATGSTGEFVDTPTQRFVRSLFHPIPVQVQSTPLGASVGGIVSTTPAELAAFRVGWLQFAHEAGMLVGRAVIFVTTAAGTSTCAVWFDGDYISNGRSTALGDSALPNYSVSLPVDHSFGPDLEGYHYASLAAGVGASQSGTITTNSGLHGIIR